MLLIMDAFNIINLACGRKPKFYDDQFGLRASTLYKRTQGTQIFVLSDLNGALVEQQLSYFSHT